MCMNLNFFFFPFLGTNFLCVSMFLMVFLDLIRLEIGISGVKCNELAYLLATRIFEDFEYIGISFCVFGYDCCFSVPNGTMSFQHVIFLRS